MEMEPTYRIVRTYYNVNREREVIKTGLTLGEAKKHINSPMTVGDGWFDGYAKEKELDKLLPSMVE